jgi:hypothetical protein
MGFVRSLAGRHNSQLNSCPGVMGIWHDRRLQELWGLGQATSAPLRDDRRMCSSSSVLGNGATAFACSIEWDEV